MAFKFIACSRFTDKKNHILWLPTATFWINQQFVEGTGIRLGEGQRNKMVRIVVVIYTDDERITVFHFLPLWHISILLSHHSDYTMYKDFIENGKNVFLRKRYTHCPLKTSV